MKIFLPLLFLVAACSSGESNVGPSPELIQQPESDRRSSDPEVESQREARQTTGKLHFVTTTLNNENVIEGSVPQNALSESLLGLDDLARKEPDNTALLITYLSFLRLHGNSTQAYENYSRKGGENGAKSVWFLLETGYGALKKKDYGLADYLFNKAETQAGSNAAQKAAVTHAFAVRLLLMNKTQSGIVLMRKAAESQPPYLPSLLTLGFLGLKSGDAAGAERLFRAASSAYPSSLNARIGLAAALRGRGKTEDAITVMQGIYRSHGRDRRVAWNYALILADHPPSQKEAMDVLTKYFQLPGSLPEIDTKANLLISKLQRPVPVSAAPVANNTPAPEASVPSQEKKD